MAELDDPAALAAIDWLVLLKSGTATAADAAAFAQWRAADPRHDAACARIESTLGQFSAPGATAGPSADDHAAMRAALRTPSGRRRAMSRLLGVGGLGLGAAWIAANTAPFEALTADLSTGRGIRARHAMTDGGVVVLNARTRVDIATAPLVLHLLDGELQVRIDTRRAAPLAVRTREGLVRATSGDFTVRQQAHATRLNNLTGDLEIVAASGRPLRLAAGRSADLAADHLTVLPDLSPYAESAWVDGQLQVFDRPLEQVVDALRDYRAGIIRLDPRAAQLRVSGVFPLDNTDLAMLALADTMPIRIRTVTPYWVSIEAV